MRSTSNITTTWRIAPDRELDLDRPRLMGILNVTNDSFSDGGRFTSADEAVEAALGLVEEGADVIDVGGESTRPGAERVGAVEQIARVVPVIGALSECSDVLMSVDTTLADVAEAALDAGAVIINDVSAGIEDERMLALAARWGCGMILMHRLRAPGEDRYSDRYDVEPEYADVVSSVQSFLGQRIDDALRAGVAEEAIAIDPGLGFGKSVQQNYELIARIEAFVAMGRPVLSGSSRKSFVGAVCGVDEPIRRLPGSLAIALAHYAKGVRLFRVHDVAAHRQCLAVVAAIEAAS